MEEAGLEVLLATQIKQLSRKEQANPCHVASHWLTCQVVNQCTKWHTDSQCSSCFSGVPNARPSKHVLNATQSASEQNAMPSGSVQSAIPSATFLHTTPSASVQHDSLSASIPHSTPLPSASVPLNLSAILWLASPSSIVEFKCNVFLGLANCVVIFPVLYCFKALHFWSLWGVLISFQWNSSCNCGWFWCMLYKMRTKGSALEPEKGDAITFLRLKGWTFGLHFMQHLNPDVGHLGSGAGWSSVTVVHIEPGIGLDGQRVEKAEPCGLVHSFVIFL